jgi:hypothetical protein
MLSLPQSPPASRIDPPAWWWVVALLEDLDVLYKAARLGDDGVFVRSGCLPESSG